MRTLALVMLLLVLGGRAQAQDPGAPTDTDAPLAGSDTDTDAVDTDGSDTDGSDTDTDAADTDAGLPPGAVLRRDPRPPPSYDGERLIVGVTPSPPFAFQGPEGDWQGVSLDLWAAIADDAGIPWELRVTDDLDTLLAEVAAGRIDVAAPALTITASREDTLDFSHAYYETGYGIAVRRSVPGLGYFSWMLSTTFWRVVLGLFLLLLVIGAIVWLVERRHNEEFGGSTAEGLVSGLWWSAVTMTTVGYGDKSPRTLLGRLVALVWMFASIIVISSFTAAIASSLTATQLDLGIQGPDDLPGHTIGAIRASTGEAWLQDEHLAVRSYPSLAAALDDLSEGEIDAVVHDAPILRYEVRATGLSRIHVLPETFGRQSYAFALPDGFEERELVNRALLDRMERGWWKETLRRYQGE